MKKIINRTNGKILGSIIKMNRLHQNMSQKALSDGICVSSYLSRIENAEIIPSEQVISELFEALAIHYNDSDAFLEEGTALLNHFLEELMFNEFSTSRQIFEQIEQKSHMFRHSPLIIDYYIVCLAFYCTRSERHIFESTRSLLESVEELMTNDQRFKYYLYYGIDHAKVYRDYKGALDILFKAKSFDVNGHLFYWLGYSYLKCSNTIKAFEMFTKALKVYVEEANLLSIIGSYEMLGLTHYRAGHYEDGLSYFQRGLKLAQKINSAAYISAFNCNIAWGYLNLKQVETCLALLENTSQKFTSETVIHSGIVSFLAYLSEGRTEGYQALLPVFAESCDPWMTMFKDVIEQHTISEDSPPFIDSEVVLRRLIEMTEPLNHELNTYLRHMMVKFYKSKRRYKEALDLCYTLGE